MIKQKWSQSVYNVSHVEGKTEFTMLSDHYGITSKAMSQFSALHNIWHLLDVQQLSNK